METKGNGFMGGEFLLQLEGMAGSAVASSMPHEWINCKQLEHNKKRNTCLQRDSLAPEALVATPLPAQLQIAPNRCTQPNGKNRAFRKRENGGCAPPPTQFSAP